MAPAFTDKITILVLPGNGYFFGGVEKHAVGTKEKAGFEG
jgi:hypothetical protein